MAPSGQSNNSADRLYIVLEKMIEAQVENTVSIAALKDNSAEIEDAVKQINTYFSNGFRSEIKKHMTKETEIINSKVEALTEEIKGMKKSVRESIQEIKQPSFWIKVFAALFGGIVTIVGAVYAAIKLFGV